MQEYINANVLIEGKLSRKNFAIEEGILFFKYKATGQPIDLEGKIVSPGFVDMHVHTRTPGYTYKEDLEHLTEAALAGGFTTIVAMANLKPLPVNLETYEEVLRNIKTNKLNIIQTGRATINGTRPVNFRLLNKYTKIFTDDGSPIDDEKVMSEVLKGAADSDSLILLHEEDHSLAGVGYHSELFKKLGYKTFGPEYEWRVVERDIKLNKKINAKIHLQHISVKETIPLLKKAAASGMNISAEITPHHLFLSNEVIIDDGKFKMNPPLGNENDRQELIKAFEDGVVKVIGTDHAPHTDVEKSGGFEKSFNGIIGLESAFGVCLKTLGMKNIESLLRALTINPAELLGLDVEISNGEKANIVIIDPCKKWIFKRENIKSKSFNSPFIGMELEGKVEKTIYGKIERNY